MSRWKAARDGATPESGIADLKLKDKAGDEIEKRLPGGKVKKKAKAEVVLETSTRSKKKCVTTIQGGQHPPKDLDTASKSCHAFACRLYAYLATLLRPPYH